MFKDITTELKNMIFSFPLEDILLFKNEAYPIQKQHFVPVVPTIEERTIAFIDGGQAEIISAGNFCLSFIRVFGQVFQGTIKKEHYKNEFYLFTRAVYKENDLVYESKIFSLQEKIIDEIDLIVSSVDALIRHGVERAPISRITSMARRFAELSLAARMNTDFVVLDGTLDRTYPHEEKYFAKLPHVSALAKSSSLFTISGNSPAVLLRKIGLENCWQYPITELTSFVRLHEKSKHVFRFEGDTKILPFLLKHCNDSLFLGYPYGLLHTDKMARVSNEEKKSMRTTFLLSTDNKEVIEYLHTKDAHDILDRIS